MGRKCIGRLLPSSPPAGSARRSNQRGKKAPFQRGVKARALLRSGGRSQHCRHHMKSPTTWLRRHPGGERASLCRRGRCEKAQTCDLMAHQSEGPVAQWIRHRPTEPGIAGSSPAGVMFRLLPARSGFLFTDANVRPFAHWAGESRRLRAAAALFWLVLAGTTCVQFAASRVSSRSPRGPPARRRQSRGHLHRVGEGHSRHGEACAHHFRIHLIGLCSVFPRRAGLQWAGARVTDRPAGLFEMRRGSPNSTGSRRIVLVALRCFMTLGGFGRGVLQPNSISFFLHTPQALLAEFCECRTSASEGGELSARLPQGWLSCAADGQSGPPHHGWA